MNNTSIINKLKNRVPYLTSGSFALVIKLSNIKLENYTLITKGEPHIAIKNFKIYFVCLCIIAITWDLIHTLEATITYNVNNSNTDSSNDDINEENLTYEDHTLICYKIKKIIKKISFCFLSLIIALLLFITFTNILTNGLPFYIFFGFTNDLDILIYGIIIPSVYILTILEETFMKKYLDIYISLEKKDDINETTNLFGARKKNTARVANII